MRSEHEDWQHWRGRRWLAAAHSEVWPRSPSQNSGGAHGVSARRAGPAGLRCRAHTYSRHARVRTRVFSCASGVFVRFRGGSHRVARSFHENSEFSRKLGVSEFSLGVFPRSFHENSEFQLGVKSEFSRSCETYDSELTPSRLRVLNSSLKSISHARPSLARLGVDAARERSAGQVSCTRG